MPLRICRHVLAAFILAATFSGCAQMSGKLPAISLKPKQSTATRFNVARLYERQNRLGAARKLYTELHEDSPENLEVLHRLATISTRLGDFETATMHYEQSLVISPDNSEVLADYGYSLYLQGEKVTAESTLRRSLDLNPDNKRAVGNLALLAGMGGRIDESLSLYRQIVGEAEAQANVGYIHVQRGEGDLAMKRYDRALTLDQDMETAAMALVKLAELKGAQPIRNAPHEFLQIADKAEEPIEEKDVVEIDLAAELIRGQSRANQAGRANIHSPRQIERPAGLNVAPEGSW